MPPILGAEKSDSQTNTQMARLVSTGTKIFQYLVLTGIPNTWNPSLTVTLMVSLKTLVLLRPRQQSLNSSSSQWFSRTRMRVGSDRARMQSWASNCALRQIFLCRRRNRGDSSKSMKVLCWQLIWIGNSSGFQYLVSEKVRNSPTIAVLLSLLNCAFFLPSVLLARVMQITMTVRHFCRAAMPCYVFINIYNTASARMQACTLKVIVRIRPLIGIEDGTTNIVAVNEQTLTVFVDEYNKIETKFDVLVDQYKTQREMFANVSAYVDRILEGFNFTIFAYGQTGSGKTYTMFGKDWENSFDEVPNEKGKKVLRQKSPITDVSKDQHYAGLIPRSCHHLFECLGRYPGQFSVFCSFMQVYNEKVYDLLQDSPIPSALNVHESKNSGIFVDGLGEFEVREYTDCLELMKRGEKNRFIRQTSMNAKSSRSHTIYQILVQSTSPNAKGEFTRARLNLCDLAGSEKINKKEVMGDAHLDELKNINLSLSTLGKVINSLSRGGVKNTAIFRQSKLTRLLQQSLVGSTNTVVIGSISPSSRNRDETLNTLKFVERAKHIKLAVKANSISSQSEDVVRKLQQEMQQLKKMLHEKSTAKPPKEVQQKLTKLEAENRALKSLAEERNQGISSLAEQNKRIRQALARMEKLAAEQLSNVSYSYSDDGKDQQVLSRLQPLKLNGQVKLNQGNQSRYKGNFTTERSILLPAINEKRKFNKSLDILPQTGLKKSDIDETKKRNVISKLQTLQNIKNTQQLKMMDDLETIGRFQRANSERAKAKNSKQIKQAKKTYQTIEKDIYVAKPRKKLDFSEKIRELEARLKKQGK